MEIVIRAAAAAVIGSILALLLRKYTPELSLTVTILAGVIIVWLAAAVASRISCLLYTNPSPRDPKTSRMPSSA